MTSLLISLGFTRDSWTWFWAKWTGLALLIMSGLVDFTPYLPPKFIYWMRAIAVLSLFVGGHFGPSSLPGASHVTQPPVTSN